MPPTQSPHPHLSRDAETLASLSFSFKCLSTCLEGKPSRSFPRYCTRCLAHGVQGIRERARIFCVPPGWPQLPEVCPAHCLQGAGALQLRRNFLGAGFAGWPCFPRQPAFSFSTHFSFAVLGLQLSPYVGCLCLHGPSHINVIIRASIYTDFLRSSPCALQE